MKLAEDMTDQELDQEEAAEEFVDKLDGMRTMVELEAVAKRKYVRDLRRHKLDTGRWIMITKQLPNMEFDPPPPMSIHWSTPWPMKQETCVNYNMRRGKPLLWGKEHNPVSARKVVFYEHEFRIFDDEFSTLTDENMMMYVTGIEGQGASHILRPARGVAEQRMIDDVVKGERRLYYDAALVDGCTETQAFQVAMGYDITNNIQFPPLGWYQCRQEYIDKFF